jgi:hypothetical protein
MAGSTVEPALICFAHNIEAQKEVRGDIAKHSRKSLI